MKITIMSGQAELVTYTPNFKGNIMKKLFKALLLAGLLGISSASFATTAMSDYAENKFIDYVFRGQASGLPATFYIALYTDTCADSSNGTEVSTSGTGYARQAVVSGTGTWANTQNSGTGVSSGTTGITRNSSAIAWTTSTAAWGTIQSVGWTDASTAGNRWFCLDLTSTLNVSGSGFTVQFTAGQLQIYLDQ